jgi:Zn-dependent peptidase ImmA (M78 family)
LSFAYQKRSPQELEEIAAVVFERYPHRCGGYFVDVEGILEDCGLTILPREGGLRKLVEGYVATDPHYIIVPEQLTSYAPRYRPVIAEELCHAILEYEFLAAGKLPLDAQPHKLTPKQHRDIEADALYLSLAVLFPKEKFKLRFQHHLEEAPPEFSWERGRHLRYCADNLETDFHVWSLKVAERALHLGLIERDEYQKHFSDRLAF